jgi:hypothetical protein
VRSAFRFNILIPSKSMGLKVVEFDLFYYFGLGWNDFTAEGFILLASGLDASEIFYRTHILSLLKKRDPAEDLPETLLLR